MIGLGVLLVAVELVRVPNRWLVPFVVAVVGGEELLATLIKNLVDRARPAFNPAAATLGPSFPSGHTTTAAAFWAAAALLLGRRRPRAPRALLAGGAAGIAVAVASSRVLLDLHWLTDVIGGLALGWAWFALCGIAFGGRVLRFGVAAEVAESAAMPTGGSRTRRPRPRPRLEPQAHGVGGGPALAEIRRCAIRSHTSRTTPDPSAPSRCRPSGGSEPRSAGSSARTIDGASTGSGGTGHSRRRPAAGPRGTRLHVPATRSTC